MHGLLLMLHKMPRPIAAAEQVCLHYRMILTSADQEEPPPHPGKRGRPKQSAGRNLLNRLRKYEDGVLAFALEANVPFTNASTGSAQATKRNGTYAQPRLNRT